MNWHSRYAQQANWTRDLRHYIFSKIGSDRAQQVLEVGCGTGAILAELPKIHSPFGLDINFDSLLQCQAHVPNATIVQGDALQLPFLKQSFDVVYSHFLLLWVRDPLRALQEMKRVARAGGHVIAFAEPNYLARVDQPSELIPLGRWQTESLIRQGADPGMGARLADLFDRAEIEIVETGMIQSQRDEPPLDEWQLEWDVLESDLAGWVPEQDIQKMKQLDRQARERKRRVLNVPTYFAWGTKK